MLPALTRNAALPDCAWVLDVQHGDAVLLGGDRVEAGDGFVAEGAWRGDFTADHLVTTEFRAGSGVTACPGGLVLVPPSHALEAVYCYVNSDFSQVLASNSLHLIIARRPDAAPQTDLELIRQRARTLMRGVNAYERLLYATPAGSMFRFAWDPVELDFDQCTVRQPFTISALQSPFRTFAGYRAYLSDTVREVLANAGDPERHRPYAQLISSCSSGYDSSAAAVLARENGCTQTVTLSEARGGLTDSGEEVAAALGMACEVYERFGSALEARPPGRDFYIAAEDVPEEPYLEFLGSINSSEDMIFTVFEPKLADSVFLTGFHGDKIWEADAPSGPEVQRGDHSGSGFDEFRKRVGFVHIPVPFIGARHYEAIRRITSHLDMAPFHIGGKYDRPLPRRIVEEAGVSREMFGQTKLAGSLQLQPWLDETRRLRNDAFYRLVDRYRDALGA